MAMVALLGKSGSPTNQRFFQWPAQKEQLLAHVEANRHKDVYTSPSLYRGTRARKELVASLSVVHADADTFNVEDALLEPSLIITTSQGHTHLYWDIIDSTDPRVLESLSHSVSVAHSKSETGLDDGWASNKLMRVPGTTNTKYEAAFIVSAEMTGVVYSVEEFSAAYPPIIQAEVEMAEMGDLPSYAEAMKSVRATQTLMDLTDHSKDHWAQDRSDALFLLEQELFRCGATNEVAFVICQRSPFNKFEQDGKHNAEELLWKDILRARAKSDAPELEEADAAEVQGAEVTVEPLKKDVRVDFLTDDEKQQMAPTWVDEYIAWAMTKTDADAAYHEAAALTILATIFSDYGHALPKFGPLGLNLWFMVLGSTTRSRKSTSRDLMLKFINALEDDDRYRYELASDFTSEGLSNALQERPGRSSLLHRDEFQGLINEQKSKVYLAGLLDSLTDLYGGKVRAKLRATGESKKQKSVRTQLSFFAMGIKNQVADSLHEEDFQSGFLTRFIFVAAEPPKRTRESDYIAQMDLTEAKKGDPVFTKLLQSLEASRDFWETFHPLMAETGVERMTAPVPCAPVAWERLNKFIRDVLDASEGVDWGDIVEASAHRLGFSILKVATLLAMMDCCDTVTLPHMLSAINYARDWFAHLLDMTAAVSASGWKKRLKTLENIVLEAGGSIRWEHAFKKMNTHFDMKIRDFMEVAEALSEMGVCHIYINETGKSKIKMIEHLEMAA